jgi:hypothetical protein
MASTAKKQGHVALNTQKILAGCKLAHGRYFLKESKKFANFPELLGMQER